MHGSTGLSLLTCAERSQTSKDSMTYDVLSTYIQLVLHQQLLHFSSASFTTTKAATVTRLLNLLSLCEETKVDHCGLVPRGLKPPKTQLDGVPFLGQEASGVTGSITTTGSFTRTKAAIVTRLLNLLSICVETKVDHCGLVPRGLKPPKTQWHDVLYWSS